MTRQRTRRNALAVAIGAPLGLTVAKAGAVRADEVKLGGSEEARTLARAWFASLATGQLDSRTHASIVLILHGYGAGLDGAPERFEGRDAVAAVLAGAGPARWDVEDVLAEDQRAAVRGRMWLRDGSVTSFAAFLTLRDGQIVRVERHLDRVLQQHVSST